MSAGQRQVAGGASDFAQQHMRGNELTAIGKEPTKLIERDIHFARFNHEQDLFQIFRAIASTSRMDENPTATIGRATNAETARGSLRTTLRFALGHN